MKTLRIFLCILFLSTTVVAQKFTLNIKVLGAKENAKVYIQIGQNKSTTVLLDGNAVLKGNVEETQRINLFVDYLGDGQFNHRYNFFLSSGQTNISINDITGKDELTVSENQNAMDYEYKLSRPVIAFNKLVAENTALFKQSKEKGSIDTTVYQNLKNRAIFDCFQVPQKYVKENPKSQLCITALKMMGKGSLTAKVNTDTLKELYASLASEVKESEEGKKYGEWLNKL